MPFIILIIFTSNDTMTELHLPRTFHITRRRMIQNKSTRHWSCNAQGMINIRWHFFQINYLNSVFFLCPVGTTGIRARFVKGCTQRALLAFDLTAHVSPSPFCWAAWPSCVQETAGDSPRPPPGEISKSYLSKSQKQHAHLFSLTGRMHQACGVLSMRWEEELSRKDGESSERPWLPAAPLPSGLCSPDGNLGEMKSTAVPRCTMLVPSWFFLLLLKKVFNWQCSVTKQNPSQESPEVALFFLNKKCQSHISLL